MLYNVLVGFVFSQLHYTTKKAASLFFFGMQPFLLFFYSAYYYVLLAVKASRRKSRTLRIGLSPLPFLWTAVAGSIIIIVSVRNSYSSFLCYLACVSLSAGLLHSPLPTLALKSPSTILFHGGYVQIAGNSQQEVIAPNRYSILCLLVKLSKSC